MQNKVVIITGASSGIGKALVYEFAKRGAKIAMGAHEIWMNYRKSRQI